MLFEHPYTKLEGSLDVSQLYTLWSIKWEFLAFFMLRFRAKLEGSLDAA